MSFQNRLEQLQGACTAFCRLVRFTASWHPTLTVVLSLLCAAGGVLYAVRDLSFVTSGRDLLPPDAPYVQRDAEYGHDFGETNGITVVVESQNPVLAKAYARHLVRELEQDPGRFERVTYRIDPEKFEGRALLYLSTGRLATIRDKIFDYHGFMTSFAARSTLDQLITNIKTQVVSGFVSRYFDLDPTEPAKAVDLGFVRDVLSQISTRLDRPAQYRSPWTSLFALDTHGKGAGYFLSDDERLLFILIEPAGREAGFAGHREVIETLRTMVARLQHEYPGVNVGVTGAQALSNDEMIAAFRDSKRATVLAFTLTLALLVLAFRRIGTPVLMLLTLAVSLCWSIGIITIVIGHLSIFSVMFVSIVVGIGIDYGIYFLFRHDEELLAGRGEREALEVTAMRSGPGMLSGSLTAAGTFYVLMATDFLGIRELGFIAGTSILCAWLAMMTLFPAVIVLTGRRRVVRAPRLGAGASALDRRTPVIDRITCYPKTVLVAAGLVTVASLIALPSVTFDYNLLRLQASGTESVIWEKRTLEAARRSSFTGLATAGSLAELQAKADAFARLGSVSEVDSVLLLIPRDQAAKQKIIGDFASLVASVGAATPEPLDLDRLTDALTTLERRLDLAVDEAPPSPDRDEVVAVRDQTAALVRKLARVDAAIAAPALTHLQHQVYRDFARTLRTLQDNLRPAPVGVSDLPDELRRQFVGRSGRFLLQIHPKVDIWERAGAERFVADLRSIDPEVTGVPIITFEAIVSMEKAYKQGTLYALVLVALLCVMTIRRPREAALAMLPLVLGTLWTVGLMVLFRLPFNLGNVFGLPLIIGAGAEFGLNVVLRYLEGRRAHGGALIGRSTVMAVLVNGLTTIVGFGSLMIADHRGIFGLGLLLTLGMIATLTAALIVLPVTLRWGTQPLSMVHPLLVEGPPLESAGTR